jgi:hypothetical protein
MGAHRRHVRGYWVSAMPQKMNRALFSTAGGGTRCGKIDQLVSLALGIVKSRREFHIANTTLVNNILFPPSYSNSLKQRSTKT